MSASKTPIRYYPPDKETIDRFSREVCRSLGDEFASVQVMHEFSAFVRLVAELQAERLNQVTAFDSPPDQAMLSREHGG